MKKSRILSKVSFTKEMYFEKATRETFKRALRKTLKGAMAREDTVLDSSAVDYSADVVLVYNNTFH